jgi:hypothetical protein
MDGPAGGFTDRPAYWQAVGPAGRPDRSAGAPADCFTECPDQGSAWVEGRRESGPPLGCPHAPWTAAWDLWTPPHRAPAPRPGFRPGDARAFPRLLVRYRCTGFWLVPKVVLEVKTLGYVFDVEQARCR